MTERLEPYEKEYGLEDLKQGVLEWHPVQENRIMEIRLFLPNQRKVIIYEPPINATTYGKHTWWLRTEKERGEKKTKYVHPLDIIKEVENILEDAQDGWYPASIEIEVAPDGYETILFKNF